MSPVTVLSVFFALLVAGLPIFLVLGMLSMGLFWLGGKPMIALPQLFIDHLKSEILVAIPFFVIAATFMQRGGIAKALVDVAYAWVGSLRGGLALVCVVATMIFAAISGSSVATAMAMGTLLVPAMLAKGYERHFAVGVVGASGTLGILIPPSLAMIIFAVIAEESVPKLFLAGVLPACYRQAYSPLGSSGTPIARITRKGSAYHDLSSARQPRSTARHAVADHHTGRHL